MSSYSSTLALLFERNQEATIYVGNIDQKVTEEILWELFTQCGPVINIHLPKDKISSDHQGFAFVEFRSEEDADYAIKIMHMIKLYGKPLKVNRATQDKRTQEIGANIFVGNLAEDVDEKVLKTRIVNKHDTEANWLKATTFVPKAGELIVYDPDTTYNYTRIKIGDGSTKVNALNLCIMTPINTYKSIITKRKVKSKFVNSEWLVMRCHFELVS